MAKRKKDYEAELAFQLRACNIDFKAQFQFHPERKWRFDFCFPEKLLAVEIQGITKIGFTDKGQAFVGGHQSPKGMREDLEKFDEAMRMGWRVYCCDQKMVTSGRALQTIEILLGLAKAPGQKQMRLV